MTRRQNEETKGGRDARAPRGWHSRGFLPHFEAGERPQAITFRLADSLPRERLDALDEELRTLPKEQATDWRRRQIESLLDQGAGSCALRAPFLASLVQSALLHFDGERCRLHAWVAMPNHVHVLATPLGAHSLSQVVHSWKSFTAKEANRHLGQTGAFWMQEYFDRWIRNEEHHRKAIDYIELNPVKAGLCGAREDWPFSSAGYQACTDVITRVCEVGETPALPGSSY